MNFKQQAFKQTANTIISWLEKRNMEGYYFETSEEAVKAILEMIPDKSSIAWGGSVSFTETGMLDALKAGDYELIDRTLAQTPQQAREIFAKTVLSDYYFMSSNAITTKGELVNIDGNSNRVACLCHGPAHVMLLVGMNKVTSDVESAVKRVRTHAAPANAARLHKETPCGKTGVCADCIMDGCMCSNIVITRRSAHKGRIKVFLIGEELGF